MLMHWETVCSIALSLESSVDVGQWWYQHRLGGLDRDPRNPMSGGSLFIDRWWSSGISTIHTVQVLATYTIWYSTNGIVVPGRVKKKGKEKKKEKKEEICKRTTELQKKEAKVQKKKWTKKVSSVVTLPTCKKLTHQVWEELVQRSGWASANVVQSHCTAATGSLCVSHSLVRFLKIFVSLYDLLPALFPRNLSHSFADCLELSNHLQSSEWV